MFQRQFSNKSIYLLGTTQEDIYMTIERSGRPIGHQCYLGAVLHYAGGYISIRKDSWYVGIGFLTSAC